MPTIPDDLKNLDISCEDIFEKTWKNFKEATRRVFCWFDDGHFKKDKIPTAEIDNDPEDPSHEDDIKSSNATSVIKIIREKKRRPKLELPNDHDRKGPRPLNDHNYFPLKIIGIIKKILGSTRWIPVLLFVILAALTYTFFASVRENEPRELQPRQSCLGESALVNESSGPFYDVDECEHEQKILECTDNSKVKACFRDHDEKSLYAVCIINICLYDQACPEVTRDLNNALVVHSYYRQCQSCKNIESLQSRLNEYGNVGAGCLNISGTSPQPIRTNEDDGLVLKVAIPILVLVAIIGVGLGIGFWFFKYRRGRNNQQNINNANHEDQKQNGGAVCLLLTQNGEARSELLTQNGGAVSELLTQNGGARSELLTQNGGARSELLTQNGGAGSELLTQNRGGGSKLLTQNGGMGSELLTQNRGWGSKLLTQNRGAGSELPTQNGGAGSELLTQNGGARSELLTQNGEEEREPLMQIRGEEV